MALQTILVRLDLPPPIGFCDTLRRCPILHAANVVHRFSDILFIAIAAVLCGADGWVGKIERAIDQRVSFGCGKRDKDADLTVLDPSSRAGVLSLNTDRLLPFLRNPVSSTMSPVSCDPR